MLIAFKTGLGIILGLAVGALLIEYSGCFIATALILSPIIAIIMFFVWIFKRF
jgi:chromate transport protein ChrA